MTYKAEGIIINKKDFREADRLFTIYTLEYGKVEVLAQGTRKLASKLAGNLEILHHATFTFAKGKQIDRIATVDLIASHEQIKVNLEKLTCALYFLQVCDTAIKVGEPDPGPYELLNDFLSYLESFEGSAVSPLAKISLIKLSILMGYRPQVKQGKELLDLLETQPISAVFEKKSFQHLDTLSQKSLELLLERPARSAAFFDFLTGEKKQKNR